MYILTLYIVLFLGGPEQAYQIKTYMSELQCEQAKEKVWSDMNQAYPAEEHILYRFDCVKTGQPKLRRIYATTIDY